MDRSSIEFIVSTLIGLIGCAFSVSAFFEARGAKAAAKEAGRSVKIQTITIELTELSQRLDKLKMDIHFDEARDFINEIQRRLRRLISPFQKDPDFSDSIIALREALLNANNSLKDVCPTNTEEAEQAPNTVYYAIQEHLSAINGYVADIIGLFEKRTIENGEQK